MLEIVNILDIYIFVLDTIQRGLTTEPDQLASSSSGKLPCRLESCQPTNETRPKVKLQS